MATSPPGGMVGGVGLCGAVLTVDTFVDPRTPQPIVWVAITVGHHLLGLVLASVIRSVWSRDSC